ncbi:MAG: hypothetical protein QXH91_09565, partial [Candidatus Bathyarchaeia archaeon]
FVVDGLGILTSILSYDELPESDAFLNSIKDVQSVEQYLDVLRKHRTTFLSFKGSKLFTMVGLASHEELILDLQTSMSHFQKGEVVKAISLNPRVSWKHVNQMAETLLKIRKDSEDDIQKLIRVKDTLISQSNRFIRLQEENMKNLKKQFDSQIEKDESKSRNTIESLQKECESKFTQIEKKKLEDVENLKRQQAKAQAEILKLKLQEEEHIKNLNNLKTQLKNLNAEFTAAKAKCDKLSLELSNFETELNELKLEKTKIKSLAEARKDSVNELDIEKELKQVEKKISKVNATIYSINREIQKLDEKRKKLEAEISLLNKQINSLTELA